MQLLGNANGSALQWIYLDQEQTSEKHYYESPWWVELKKIRKLFLTQNAVAKMIGMAKGNLPPDPLRTENKPNKKTGEEEKQPKKSKERSEIKGTSSSDSTVTAGTSTKKKQKKQKQKPKEFLPKRQARLAQDPTKARVYQLDSSTIWEMSKMALEGRLIMEGYEPNSSIWTSYQTFNLPEDVVVWVKEGQDFLRDFTEGKLTRQTVAEYLTKVVRVTEEKRRENALSLPNVVGLDVLKQMEGLVGRLRSQLSG
eukprot:TRINITY_DN7791_c0_g1_i1.p1 TRINITY_DN7791_c0_g1~~TRINITY_DN7791_c0_g1_i1.p1  ORF type:complete len:254 (+),score=58.49 TRINITY_DN7791_c0_g1_i1:481-1242(+)